MPSDAPIPESSTPSATPVVETPPLDPTPAVAATPDAPSAPVPAATPEPAPESGKPFAHTDTPALLADAPKVEDPKPASAEPPKPEAAIVEGVPPAVDETPKPTYAAFTLPEGVTIPDAQLTAFHDVLGQHKLPQEAGQALLDMHLAAMTAQRDQFLDQQQRDYAKVREGWRNEWMADEVLGGARYQTNLQTALRVIDHLLPNANERAAFKDALGITGMGDHPTLAKLLIAAAPYVMEPAVPKVVGQPTSTNGRAPQSKTKAMYPNTDFGAR